MLSVLIYQKSSQSFIDQYRALFEPFEESGKIAFCFWDEHGTDVASALPELTGILRGVRSWQAIVVMPVSDSDSRDTNLCREDNPFDFLCNSDPEPPVHESQIPLIRLSQMLGGIPLVNQHYVNTRTLNTENRDQMRVLRRESTEELQAQQRIWNDLNDKYSFPCERPERVYLFKARQPMDIRLPVTKDTDSLRRHEINSSLFWYRNRYPATARFLTQDCRRPGNARYHEDLFQFWMTALTLALNHFPTGTFEAYKVYTATGIVDRNKVHELFSNYYNRLGGVQYSANIQIGELRKSSQFQRRQESLPMYRCDIPVHFELQESPDLMIPSKRIGLSRNCPEEEEPWWHRHVQNSVRAVRKLHGSTKMTLDRASIQCRYASKVTEDELCELDEYQIEEMQQQLSGLETSILTFSTYTALPINKYYRDLAQAEKDTASQMKKRMSKKTAIIAGLSSLAVYMVGFIPDLVHQLQEGNGFLSTLGLALLGCLFMLLAAFGCLLYFRWIITDRIHSYNGIIAGIVRNFQQAGSTFSDYLTNCCSLMRGRFMLQALTRRTLISTQEIVKIGRHIEFLSVQMGIINNWLSDFDLKPLPDKGNHSREYFDFDIPPEKNSGYSIQQEHVDLYIPSVGGSTCKAPYPFVTEFTANREALFETESKLYEQTEAKEEWE